MEELYNFYHLKVEFLPRAGAPFLETARNRSAANQGAVSLQAKLLMACAHLSGTPRSGLQTATDASLRSVQHEFCS
jgi:hypothetical protein